MSKRKNKKPQSQKQTARKTVNKRPVAAPTMYNNRRLHMMVIFCFGFLLYANTLSHDYAQDDAIVITDNMFTQQGISGLGGIFTKDTFFGFFKVEGKAGLVSGGRYRPLSLATFAIEYQIFGASPFVGHLGNIIWYGLTGIMLYLTLLLLMNPKGDPNDLQSHFIAFATTMLFMAHPIHTEAVANIKGRDEIMVMFGSLAALYFTIKAYHSKNTSLLAAAAGVFFLALLSKENAITFLAVVPLAMYVFTKANTKEIATHSAGLVGAAVLFLIIRAGVLGESGSIGGPESQELMNNAFLGMSGGEKSATIMYTLGKYLQLLVAPFTLTHDYYPFQIPTMTWGNWQPIAAILAQMGLVGYALMRLPKKDPIAFGILFYFITLSIVSNIVVSIGANMGERFIFIPSMGFCFIISVLLYRWAKQGKTKLVASDLTKALAVLAVIVGLYSVRTVLRNPVWANDYVLFSTDVHNSPNSAKVQTSYAGETIKAANLPENAARKTAMLEEGILHANKAIEIHPTFANAWLQLGNANVYLGRYDEAVKHYQHIQAIAPNNQDATNNLAYAYRIMAQEFGEKKRDFNSAIKYLNESIKLNPNEAETYRLMGIAYGSAGDLTNAIKMLEKANTLRPNNASILFNLGKTYEYQGNKQKGAAMIQKAVELDPSLKGK